MRRDDVNEMGLTILVVVAALLVLDAIWLHVKCGSQSAEIAALTERVASHTNTVARLTRGMKLDEDSQPEPSFADKAKQAYKKVKSAAIKGFEAAKEDYTK